MSTHPAQDQEIFTINLVSETEKDLAKILFEEKPGLAESFASHFYIRFTAHDKNTLSFEADKETASGAKRAFEMMVGAMATGQHVDKKLIKTTGKTIYPDGLTEKFTAANQNTPQKSTGFTPRSDKQKLQAKLIDENDIMFSVGPAGTGKTHVAMAKAVEALKSGKVKKILLARPALESAEKLGFLPGSQNEKMAPYMRPLYDELDKAFGPGKYKAMIDSEIVEIVPIGFMRGRTFEKSFIIIDEAQNCELDHLKMAITRLGPGSKMVITGDPEQVDLKPKSSSGLITMVEKLEGVEGVAIQTYDISDIVRHPTVKRVIDRLEGETPAKQPVKAPKRP